MRSNNQFSSLLATAALAMGLAFAMIPGSQAAEKKAPVKINLTLLHINDVYEITPKKGRGGIAELATLIKAERARAKNTLTTLGGDLLSPSVMSGLTQGAQMIDMMNALGVDAAGFGNHEFDFGGEVLKQRIAASKFTWLATNTQGPDGKPFGGATALMTRKFDGITVGLFSILTPETSYLSSPGKDVIFTPAIETAAAAVKTLRKDMGADFVIALTHLDLELDRKMARSVRGINVILGGHDHDPIGIFEGKTLIMKAGYDGHYLAVADLVIVKKETKRGIKVSMLPQWRMISTAGVTPDPQVAGIVKGFTDKLDKELDVAVGKTSVELDSQRSSVRSRETTFGNLIADAMRAGVGADVALTNGGGIRGNRTYDAGTTLTRKDILTELPFGNVTVMLELSGANLLAALENGVSRVEDGAGRFPQISGMMFKFDSSAKAGSRVGMVMVGGKPLDKAAKYTLATNDYIAGGGDGYKVFRKSRHVIDASGGTLMATMVMDYISAKGTVAPRTEGRIVGK